MIADVFLCVQGNKWTLHIMIINPNFANESCLCVKEDNHYKVNVKVNLVRRQDICSCDVLHAVYHKIKLLS